MRNQSIAEMRENFSEFLNQVAYAKERVIVTRRGKEVAALVSLDDFEIIEKAENELDIKDARKNLLDAKKKGTVSWDSIKKERRR